MNNLVNYKTSVTSKPKLITLEELSKIQGNNEAYVSIFKYNEKHKKQVEETGSIANIKDVTTDMLVWDFDNVDITKAQNDTIELAKRLVNDYAIDPDNIACYLSGGKGFHVIVSLDKEITPEQFKQATGTIAKGLTTFDVVVSDPARILRLEHSRHPKSGLYKIPLSIYEVDELSIDQIKELAKTPREEYEQTVKPVKLPESLFTIKEREKPKLVQNNSSEFDYSNPPKGWKQYKYALAQGWFEEGERHQALLVIAATCRGLGYDKTTAYYICKSAIDKQTQRTGQEKFDKTELYKNIIDDSVYSDNWNGGQFGPEHPWIIKYCAAMGFDLTKDKSQAPIVQLEDIRDEFIDYVKNIEQNTILTGIPALDEALPLTVGMNLGVIGAASSGKCLGKDTPVLMFDGTIKKVQDIKKGDLLMGDDSTPRTVLSTCAGREMLYKVHQANGDSYIVNESHILSLQCNIQRTGSRAKKFTPKKLDIEVRDYLKESNEFKRYFKGYKVGVEFQEKETLLDPYFVGLWLGDGDKNEARISTSDEPIVAYLINYAEKLGVKTTINQDSRNKTKNIHLTKGKFGPKKPNPVLELLKLENLFQNKHIPNNYMFNSTENRLKLLAGLIDSDGHFSSSNNYEITLADKNLAEQIMFLVRSLGMKCTLKEKIGGCMYKGEFKEGTYHRLYINGSNMTKIPCILERKKAMRNSTRNVLTTQIKLEKLEEGNYYGFEIDGNHRFLLGDFTVTHNTALILKILENTSNAGVVSVFASLDMRRNRLYEKLLYRMSGLTRNELYDRIKNNNAEEIFQKVKDKYKNVYFYDRSCPTVEDIKSYMLRIEEQTGKKVKLLAVDYFERVNADKSDDTAASKEVAGKLQDLVNDLNVCLITLVQPNKFALSGGPDSPILNYTSIKGSSYLYQAFRSIISIWRPFFTPELKDNDKYLQMAILKNDLGELDLFNFGWDGKKGEIWGLAEEGEEELERLIKIKNQAKENTQSNDWQ